MKAAIPPTKLGINIHGPESLDSEKAAAKSAFLNISFSDHSGAEALNTMRGWFMEITVMLTRYILPIALAAGTLLAVGGTSYAMPITSPGVASSPIVDVGWRCGPRWHMNRWGRCVPNRPVIIVRPGYRHHWHPHYWRHHHWHRGYWGR